jgi:CheY-like chemotaxis protein
MSRILIADDQNDVLEALRILLKGEGHQTDAVTSQAGIFQAISPARRVFGQAEG